MQLSPKQALSIAQATRRYNIWCGAVSSGKTYSSNRVLLDAIKNGPPGDCMILGISRATIQRNVLNELYKFMGWPSPTSKCMETKIYGRNVYFVGANDESCMRTIQGSTLAIAYGDEVAAWPKACFKMLQSRLRAPGARFYGTCNPEGPAHWFKKEMIDRAHELDMIHWTFLMEDNPALEKSYVENMKKEYTGVWFKRYILGEWAVAHGLIYDAYDEYNEYEKPQAPPNYYILGIDYGTSNATAAVLCAVSPRRWPQLRIEEEYYYDSVKKGRQKTDAELAKDIKEFIGYKSVRAIYVDPSAASLKVELRNMDLPVLDANNDVVEGIKVVSKFVAGKNLVIQKGCTNLRECIQTYSWDPKAADQGEDKPLKKRDHVMDALRYAIYTAFPRGEFSHPDEHLTIEQLRHQVYGEAFNPIGGASGGYF